MNDFLDLFASGEEESIFSVLFRPAVLLAIFSLIVTVAICMMTRPTKIEVLQIALRECQEKLLQLIDRTNCAPILLRLAFTDASSYERYLTVCLLCEDMYI